MNGPEHYKEAERLLSEAASWDSDERQMQGDAVVIAAAQAHATLALTAAQVENAYAVATNGHDRGIRSDWVEATK